VSRLQVRIVERRHPAGHWMTETIHSFGLVYSRGRVYGVTYAGTVTEEEVRDAWRTARRAFRPFDESQGCYLAGGAS